LYIEHHINEALGQGRISVKRVKNTGGNWLVTDAWIGMKAYPHPNEYNDPKFRIFGWISEHVERAIVAGILALREQNVCDDCIAKLRCSTLSIHKMEYTTLQCNAALPQDFDCVIPKPLVIKVKINGVPTRALGILALREQNVCDNCIAKLRCSTLSIYEMEYTTLQRNAALPQDFDCVIPKPLVIKVKINGVPTRALVDSGSLGDFMSSSLSDQLRLKQIELVKLLSLHLAVQGSRSKVNCRVLTQFEYQTINSTQYFDIINLSSYNIILETSFLFQH
jgi:hypothetical protein